MCVKKLFKLRFPTFLKSWESYIAKIALAEKAIEFSNSLNTYMKADDR
jgi:hypothetical protein